MQLLRDQGQDPVSVRTDPAVVHGCGAVHEVPTGAANLRSRLQGTCPQVHGGQTVRGPYEDNSAMRTEMRLAADLPGSDDAGCTSSNRKGDQLGLTDLPEFHGGIQPALVTRANCQHEAAVRCKHGTSVVGRHIADSTGCASSGGNDPNLAGRLRRPGNECNVVSVGRPTGVELGVPSPCQPPRNSMPCKWHQVDVAKCAEQQSLAVR